MGLPPRPGMEQLREHRERPDAVVVACEAGGDVGVIEMINSLLAERGRCGLPARDSRRPWAAHSRIVAYRGNGRPDCRPPRHGSRPVPVVSGESSRMRCCTSRTCTNVFLDLSRNRSRRYCATRTCGNRLHVAAYRARKAADG